MLSRFWSSSNRKESQHRQAQICTQKDRCSNSDPSFLAIATTTSQSLDNCATSSPPNPKTFSPAIAEHQTMKQDLLAESEPPDSPVATDDAAAWYQQGNLYRNAGKLKVKYYFSWGILPQRSIPIKKQQS